MAESLKTVLMSALTSKATPAESDTLIVGEGNVLKKITFSQLFTYLKDKLGINTLNTKLPYKMQVKFFKDVVVSNGGYITARPSDFDGFSEIYYISAGDNTVPGGVIISGYYRDVSNGISYLAVTNSTGQAYSGRVSFTALAIGK